MDARERRAREIHEAIGKVLFREWDPIGLGRAGPLDEYDGYVGDVYRLLSSGATVDAVAEHLARIENERMGLARLRSRDRLAIARSLCAIDEAIRAECAQLIGK